MLLKQKKQASWPPASGRGLGPILQHEGAGDDKGAEEGRAGLEPPASGRGLGPTLQHEAAAEEAEARDGLKPPVEEARDGLETPVVGAT